MTAETDLLPLPEPAFRLKWRDGAYYVSEPNIGNTDCYTAEQVRACVSSATEALRAEVAESRRKWADAESKLAACDSDLREFQQRAERLAGALREMIELRESTQRGEVHPTRHELDIVRDARAALHPTAAQEKDDA